MKTPSERKAGKHERIKKMLKVLRPEQQKPVADEQLMMLLEVKEDKKHGYKRT